MPHHFFVVRATVSDPAKRAAFDTWYANEHMPDAVKTFGAEKAWRFSSGTHPAAKAGGFQIPDQTSLHPATPEVRRKQMVARFNCGSPEGTRTRGNLVAA